MRLLRYFALLGMAATIGCVVYMGISLTVYLFGIVWLMLFIATWVDGANGRPYEPFLIVFVTLAATFSLFALNELYHPKPTVLTNVSTHTLTHAGYRSEARVIPLTGGGEPLFKGVSRLGDISLMNTDSGVFLDIPATVPVFMRVSHDDMFRAVKVDSLINRLPFTKDYLEIGMRSGISLRVDISEVGGKEIVYGCSLMREGEPLAERQELRGAYIRRSLPLDVALRGIECPSDASLDWSVLGGISLARGLAGAPKEGFYLSFNPAILSSIREVVTSEGHILPEELSGRALIPCPLDRALRVGTGLDCTPSFKLAHDDGEVLIWLDKPTRRRLPSRVDMTPSEKELFVTTEDSALVQATTREAITYPEATRFSMELSYEVDTVGKPLRLRLLATPGVTLSDLRGIPLDRMAAGDTLLVSGVSCPTSNILLLADQYEAAPFKPRDGFLMIYLALGVAILSWIVSQGKRSFHAEAIAWTLIIAFLTVRGFLAWRMQVIPPLDLTESAFKQYLSNRYVFYGTVCFILVLGAAVITLKIFGDTLYDLCRAMLQRLPGWGWLMVAVVILSMGYLGKGLTGERVAYVFVPLLMMVLTELMATMRNKGFLLPRVLTHLLAIGFTISLDTGAGIVFLLGGLLVISLRLIGDVSRREQLIGIALFSVFLLGLYCANHLVSLLFQHTYWVLSSVALVIGMVVYLSTRRWTGKGKAALWTATLLLVGGLFIGLPHFLDTHRHIFYRAEVHVSQPDEILSEHEIATEDMRRLMQNLENRWFLAHYDEYPTSDEAYTIRPHFNQGVTYQTQLTDVVVARFVIGEHGAAVVYVLLLLVIIAIGVTESGDIPRLGTSALLMLFVQGLLIVMAVTNRYLFFGQDFMLLSLASYLTLMTTGLLLLVYIVSSATRYDAVTIGGGTDSGFRLSYALLPLGLGLLALSTDPSLRGSGPRFSVKETILQADRELAFVNERFQRYQLMNGFRFSEAPGDVEGIMRRFEEETGTRNAFAKQASPFTLSLYDLFLRGGARQNGSEQLLHAKVSGSLLQLAVNHSYYSITPPEDPHVGWRGDILAIGTERKDKLLIKDGRATRELDIDYGQRLLNDSRLSYDYPIFLASVPREWTMDGGLRLVAAPRQVPFRLITQDQDPITVSPEKLTYLALRPGDVIETDRDEVRALNRSGSIRLNPASRNDFLARYMSVNGESRWVYPLGASSMLPLHLAEMYRSTMPLDGPSNADVRLSILLDLQRRVHGILGRFTTSPEQPIRRSVVVANGKGNVLTLVTATNPMKARTVNPNDPQEIYDLRNYYYMSGNYNAEEKMMSDLNLRHIYPGSSIKPLVAQSLLASLPELSGIRLFISPSDQGLSFEEAGRRIVAHAYAGKRLRFPSLTGDEIGIGGFTDMRNYLAKSSNFYNSILVYIGYYKPAYLKEQLGLLKEGKPTELFRPVGKGSKDFPQFELFGRRYTFEHWLADDALQMHEHGALQKGLLNLGLSNTFPENMNLDLSGQRYIYPMPGDGQDWTKAYFPYAYPRSSYLPEALRITRQGLTDGLKGTSLGSYPFFVTPWQMCEMYSRMFSQNGALRLSLDADTEAGMEPLMADCEDEAAYELALSERLLPGLRAVPLTGTARALKGLASRLDELGLTLYAKTGTLSFGGEASAIPESQLLALVVKRSYRSGPVLDWMRGAPQIVMYFVAEEGKHDYRMIEEVVEATLKEDHIKQYLEEE